MTTSPPSRAPVLVGLLALVVRLALAFRDVPILDRLFVPDDTYYTLAIARSLANGLGPTCDGVHPTSGFQPLLAFLLVPLFKITQSPDIGLRGAIVLMALADAVVAGLLAVLARRAWGARAGLIAGTLWALSPIAVANALGGLETSLALAMELAFIWAAARAWESDRSSDAALAGVLAGLALLARIDAAFLIALVGCGLLIKRRWRLLLITAGVAEVVVAPWWIVCVRLFGSPVPSSGAAVREIVTQQHASIGPLRNLAWTGGTLAGVPVFDARGLREHFFLNEKTGLVVYLLIVVLIVVLARALRSRPWPEQALPWFGLARAVFYTVDVPALWFMRRYLAPTEAILAFGLAGGIAYVWNRYRAGVVLFVAAVLASVFPVARWFVVQPQGTEDIWYHGIKGYRDIALETLAAAPEHAVIGSLQSGALSYFAPAVHREQRVVNLDGVVDEGAARTYQEHRLLSFAHERGVTHLADWPFNLHFIGRRGEDGMLPDSGLRELGVTRPQGNDTFHVVAIDWSAVRWREDL